MRAALQDRPQNQFTLNRFLPDNPIDDLEYRFTRGGEGLIDAATFRTYDAESPIGSRPGFSRISGELPPLSRKIRLGEYDRLRQRQAPDAVRSAILTDGVRMSRALQARMELARGDALVNASVTMAENGIQAVIDFGRTGGHTVTAGVLWSTVATATPLADLLSWQTTYNTTNGVNPGRIVMSTTAFGYLLRNADIRQLSGTTLGTPSVVTQTAISTVFEAYGLPPIEIYDAQVRVNNSAQRIIAANKVLLLPAPGDGNDPESSELGATLWGTTAESLEPEYGIGAEDAPGIVVGAYSTKDPVAVWTKAAAIGLPVLANPDLTFTATVA